MQIYYLRKSNEKFWLWILDNFFDCTYFNQIDYQNWNWQYTSWNWLDNLFWIAWSIALCNFYQNIYLYEGLKK